jgi:3,4-dihydroxy 2-butanone 4-phosphate synthase / GTP cyclohydrolase II
VDGSVNLVLQKGNVDPSGVTLVRMHPVSMHFDLLGAPGPRKRRLQRSMEAIGAAGGGLIVCLMQPLPGSAAALASPPPQTGPGGMDLRTYGIGAQILADLGVHDMELLTPSHNVLVGLEGYGLRVVGERDIPGEG